MRQNVLPAPGPARTSNGPAGASIAASCEGEAVRETEAASVATDAASAMNALASSAGSSPRVAVPVRACPSDRRTARERPCHPSPCTGHLLHVAALPGLLERRVVV